MSNSYQESSLDFAIPQEVTAADQCVSLLDRNESVVIQTQELLPDEITYIESFSILTTAIPLHRMLSIYAPGVFVVNASFKSNSSKARLRVNAERVGATSGEIYLRAEGSSSAILDFLRSFLQKNREHDQPYRVQTLVSHRILNESDQNGKVITKVNSRPFGLLPGYHAILLSSDIEALCLKVMTLSNKCHQKIASETLSSCGRPPLKPSGVDMEQVSTNNLVLDEPATKEADNLILCERKEFALIELNKREVTFIIGKNGWKIGSIREKSGAHVKVVPINNTSDPSVRFNDPNTKQFLRVTGTKSQLEKALRLIAAEIQFFRLNGIVQY